MAGTVTTKGSVGRSSKGCAGVGICKVTTSSDALSMVWESDASGRTLKLHINKEELAEKQPQSLAEFLQKAKMVFEDETEIPQIVVEQLQLTENRIAPGSYKLIQTQEEFIIVFVL